jgi:hypothetical protein|tara:strand:+ start:2668 stop:2928 length:261 start_codon:yes stop_codon:yes gene_type:complete
MKKKQSMASVNRSHDAREFVYERLLPQGITISMEWLVKAFAHRKDIHRGEPQGVIEWVLNKWNLPPQDGMIGPFPKGKGPHDDRKI